MRLTTAADITLLVGCTKKYKCPVWFCGTLKCYVTTKTSFQDDPLFYSKSSPYHKPVTINFEKIHCLRKGR
jgi:hypothetical protein